MARALEVAKVLGEDFRLQKGSKWGRLGHISGEDIRCMWFISSGGGSLFSR